MLFPTHLWVREIWPQMYSLWMRSTVQNSSKYENGRGLEYRKVNFPEYLCQGTVGYHSFSSLLFGCFSSPTNVHYLAIHTELAHHYIQYASSTVSSFFIFLFIYLFFESKRISSKYCVATSKYHQAT